MMWKAWITIAITILGATVKIIETVEKAKRA